MLRAFYSAVTAQSWMLLIADRHFRLVSAADYILTSIAAGMRGKGYNQGRCVGMYSVRAPAVDIPHDGPGEDFPKRIASAQRYGRSTTRTSVVRGMFSPKVSQRPAQRSRPDTSYQHMQRSKLLFLVTAAYPKELRENNVPQS